ncbi:hypothetical protein IIB51_03230 [Patescibacteria group bacterium]|nr:hypothetical protein [Patescibacteria group bacterium]MCH8889334.1 hypothetical protein [Patescibacteria group bacterium]
MPKDKVELLLRLGVAFAFIYPAVSAFFNPFAWVGYFPLFLGDYVSLGFALYFVGLFEIAIAFWILFGKNIFVPSTLATIFLIAIVAFNWSQMDVLFRDLPIAAMSLALALKYRPASAQISQSQDKLAYRKY